MQRKTACASHESTTEYSTRDRSHSMKRVGTEIGNRFVPARTTAKITDEGLKELRNLKNLRLLSLIGTQITDAGLKELLGLKRLLTLMVMKTQVTDQALKEFSEVLPNAHIIR